jgi:integrase
MERTYRMALKKIGPNQWAIKVSVRVPGKPYPVSKSERFSGTKTEAEARKAEIIKLLRSDLSSCSLTHQALKNLSDAISLYKEKRGPFSPSHERKIDFLHRELGHINLVMLPDRFEAWLRVLRSTKARFRDGRSAASINRHIEIIQAVFGLLVKLERIERNPISKARFPKAEEKPRDRYLSQEERLRLFNAIREHRPFLLPIIEYMMLVPCRKSELTAARREQYNAFTNTVYIPDSKADIPIYKPVPESMKEYFRSIPADCPWLFYWQEKTGRYRQWGTLQKPWAFCLKKAKLSNVRIHDLRHCAASDLYEAGNPERMIMDIAGWKTPMLSNYRHKDTLKSAQAIRFNPPQADSSRLHLSVSG